MAYGIVNADQIQSSVSGVSLGAGNASIMKNRIINGEFKVSQYNGTSAVTNVSASYVIDRFQTGYFGGGTGRTTVQQSSTAPSGFINSQLVTVTTADASPTSTSGYWLASQKIEGLNTSDLAWGTASAKTITVSAWVYSSVTGSFPLIISNSAADRNYGALFTVSSANTWTQISVTIAGDTTGTWLTTNGIGIQVIFGAGGSSSRTISTGWNTGSGSVASNVTGATQLIATNGATFYITGVQLEVGSSATGFEYRQYTTELQLCQRYYQKAPITYGAAISSTSLGTCYDYPVVMRANPTLALLTSTPYAEIPNTTGFTASGAGISGYVYAGGCDIRVTGFTGMTTGRAPTLLDNNQVSVSAEL